MKHVHRWGSAHVPTAFCSGIGHLIRFRASALLFEQSGQRHAQHMEVRDQEGRAGEGNPSVARTQNSFLQRGNGYQESVMTNLPLPVRLPYHWPRETYLRSELQRLQPEPRRLDCLKRDRHHMLPHPGSVPRGFRQNGHIRACEDTAKLLPLLRRAPTSSS